MSLLGTNFRCLRRELSANFLNKIGKKTSIAVRFSPSFSERGGSDLQRETRGMSIKFYTEEGNLDFVALDVDVFPIKDPLFFPDFNRVNKRNPKTNLKDVNMLWDFIVSHPESVSANMLIFGDIGIPDGYRHMPAFTIHTYEVYNKHAEKTYLRFHILPDAGIKTLTSEEAMSIAGQDPDYALRDLYNAIENGKYPSWTLYIQTATMEDVIKAKIDLFDVTLRWPEDDYPLKPVGTLVIDKNPENYFKVIEQIAFSPDNLVPGILGGADKLFEARRFGYRDAQNYRLGVNFNNIEVNRPLLKTHDYNRDGVSPVSDNGGESPNYFPNSFNGPAPWYAENIPRLTQIYTEPNPTNLDQVKEYYVHDLTRSERNRLIDNIVSSLRQATDSLQRRALKLFDSIYPDIAMRIAHGLKVNDTTAYALDSKYD